MGFGAIIRDLNGRVFAAKSVKVNKVFELVVGEAMAAMAALEFCNSRAIQDIILEGDSL